MTGICDDCSCLFEVGSPHECDPGEVELTRSMKLSAEMHEAEAAVVAAAKALDATYVEWKSLGVAGVRMQEALERLAGCEKAGDHDDLK